jgi:Lon protease-like protein
METPLQIPGALPIIVLPGTVLFPHALLPLHIFEERYRAMLSASLGGPRIFGVASPAEWENPHLPVPDLAEVMGIGVIRACVGRPDGTSDLILQGLSRVRIVSELQAKPFRIVQIEPFLTRIDDPAETLALSDQLRQFSARFEKRGFHVPKKMHEYLSSVQDPEVIGDLMAATFLTDPNARQEILEEAELGERLKIIHKAIKDVIA